ncbi:MAG: hypothetical protein JWO26_1400 [Rhodospirillales bacterium]|jgi:hypothetical protein|nr:hypothetical protein [Rhodospirillales bacterium]MDB5381768.1 hypothetical protein [Rhodospirillales bacterium]
MTSVSALAAIAASAAVAGFASVGSALFGVQGNPAMYAAPVFGVLSIGAGVGAATLALRQPAAKKNAIW